MADDVARFYDDLANHYHLLMADWQESIAWQAGILEKLIVDSLGPGEKRILDAACGIGTQALGLALCGHKISGSDLSPAAVARAKREAEARGLSIGFTVADMRVLSGYHAGPFDVVCVMDNSLPHLRSDEDLAATLSEVKGLLAPGGLFMASLRNYDAVLKTKPDKTELRVFDGKNGRRVVFQLWDWRSDAAGYRMYQYILQQPSKLGPVDSLLFATDYWCLTRARLNKLLEDSGLRDARWLEPEDSGYYQPIVLARA